jgi:hypothetical protein
VFNFATKKHPVTFYMVRSPMATISPAQRLLMVSHDVAFPHGQVTQARHTYAGFFRMARKGAKISPALRSACEMSTLKATKS